jgi:hypothetical protein
MKTVVTENERQYADQNLFGSQIKNFKAKRIDEILPYIDNTLENKNAKQILRFVLLAIWYLLKRR